MCCLSDNYSRNCACIPGINREIENMDLDDSGEIKIRILMTLAEKDMDIDDSDNVETCKNTEKEFTMALFSLHQTFK